MPLSYQQITPLLARQVKLLMTDVDGTLTSADDTIDTPVHDVIRELENSGIMVGLVSGRTLPGLELLARRLNISGPLIAENGAVARLSKDAVRMDLGYSRQPALDSLEKLKTLFPHSIREREDNAERLVDVVLWADDVPRETLMQHLEGVQLIDSGYIMHLMVAGINKGATLLQILDKIGQDGISPQDVLVFGDSATDLSLFELLPNSVLIPNPRLAPELVKDVNKAARYVAGIPYGEGFVQVAEHIIKARNSSVNG